MFFRHLLAGISRAGRGLVGALEQAAPVHDPDARGRDQSERQRVEPMLGREHAGRERLDVIVCEDRDRRLRHDRARIGFRDDEMHSGAGDLHAGTERLPVRIETGKRGQQRGDEC